MTRRFGFRPSVRARKMASVAAQRFLAGGAPDEKFAAALQHVRELEAALPAKRGPVTNRTPTVELEAAILREVADMLSKHPLVLLAVRQNSGSASYEASTGAWAPVHFYSFIKRPAKMRLPDIWGFLASGKYFAIEVKRLSWSKPTDQREHEQAAYLAMVRDIGGVGAFVRSVAEAEYVLGN